MTTEMRPLTRMSKSELKDALLALGYSEKKLQDEKGKCLKQPVLLSMLKAHQQGEDGLTALSSIEEDDENDIGIAVESNDKVVGILPANDDKSEEDDTEEYDPPTPNHPEWTQFVLGKFLEDEVDGKNPRVEGLRRVAGELVGELIEEGCDLVAAPTEENRFRACVKAWGVFLTPGGQTKKFEALADAHDGNCFEDYATYLVAMADTRAKGRMFRNALCLRRVIAAEEVSKTVAVAADIQQGGAIHTGQISLIRMISDRQKLSIAGVLDDLCIKYELNDSTGDVNLNSLVYEDALATIKRMREIKEERETNNG